MQIVSLQDEIFEYFQDGINPWHTAFYLTAGLLILESLVFCVFGSGVEQPWNNESSEIKLNVDEETENSKYNGR